ncbi:MAG TPA: DNA adenine methylase [Chloroflexi bacterium]|nr:DNA adenine methylase [Chloroflexota bacterium]HHW87152.1 Dam family site-specific DNA-(adenine-N6)-methyltransferase [Chloroflexota bacterium]
MKPFLKWAGGKARLVERIKAVLPSGRRLVEPFVGSGALFLNTEYDEYLLADANRDLINCYRQLQQGGPAFIDVCASYFTPVNNQPDAYYALRARFNATVDALEKAALFVYLNRHGYNGLCRYNGSGGFNVPFGRYVRPYFPRDEMLYFWRKATRCEFVVADFVTTLQATTPGDVVYCDPPYVPLSATAHFTSYSADGFSLASQWRLAQEAEAAARRGVPVVISNHDVPLTREIYAAADAHAFFAVQRNISCDRLHRTTAAELLAIFTALPTIATPPTRSRRQPAPATPN